MLCYKIKYGCSLAYTTTRLRITMAESKEEKPLSSSSSSSLPARTTGNPPPMPKAPAMLVYEAAKAKLKLEAEQAMKRPPPRIDQHTLGFRIAMMAAIAKNHRILDTDVVFVPPKEEAYDIMRKFLLMFPVFAEHAPVGVADVDDRYDDDDIDSIMEYHLSTKEKNPVGPTWRHADFGLDSYRLDQIFMASILLWDLGAFLTMRRAMYELLFPYKGNEPTQTLIDSAKLTKGEIFTKYWPDVASAILQLVTLDPNDSDGLFTWRMPYEAMFDRYYTISRQGIHTPKWRAEWSPRLESDTTMENLFAILASDGLLMDDTINACASLYIQPHTRTAFAPIQPGVLQLFTEKFNSLHNDAVSGSVYDYVAEQLQSEFVVPTNESESPFTCVLLVPHNEDTNHWVLYLVILKRDDRRWSHSVFYYDPFSDDNRFIRHLDNIQDTHANIRSNLPYVIIQIEENYKGSKGTISDDMEDGPLTHLRAKHSQTDGSSCGVWTVEAIRLVGEAMASGRSDQDSATLAQDAIKRIAVSTGKKNETKWWLERGADIHRCRIVWDISNKPRVLPRFLTDPKAKSVTKGEQKKKKKPIVVSKEEADIIDDDDNDKKRAPKQESKSKSVLQPLPKPPPTPPLGLKIVSAVNVSYDSRYSNWTMVPQHHYAVMRGLDFPLNETRERLRLLGKAQFDERKGKVLNHKEKEIKMTTELVNEISDVFSDKWLSRIVGHAVSKDRPVFYIDTVVYSVDAMGTKVHTHPAGDPGSVYIEISLLEGQALSLRFTDINDRQDYVDGCVFVWASENTYTRNLARMPRTSMRFVARASPRTGVDAIQVNWNFDDMGGIYKYDINKVALPDENRASKWGDMHSQHANLVNAQLRRYGYYEIAVHPGVVDMTATESELLFYRGEELQKLFIESAQQLRLVPISDSIPFPRILDLLLFLNHLIDGFPSIPKSTHIINAMELFLQYEVGSDPLSVVGYTRVQDGSPVSSIPVEWAGRPCVMLAIAIGNRHGSDTGGEKLHSRLYRRPYDPDGSDAGTEVGGSMCLYDPQKWELRCATRGRVILHVCISLARSVVWGVHVDRITYGGDLFNLQRVVLRSISWYEENKKRCELVTTGIEKVRKVSTLIVGVKIGRPIYAGLRLTKQDLLLIAKASVGIPPSKDDKVVFRKNQANTRDLSQTSLISYASMQKLAPNGWFGDEPVDLFFDWMDRVSLTKTDQKSETVRDRFSTTYRFQQWITHQNKKTAIPQGRHPFDWNNTNTARLFLPMNWPAGQHWSFAVIDFTTKSISIWDSYPISNKSKIIPILREFATRLDGNTESKWMLKETKNNHQKNTNDCGPLMCAFALALSRGEDPASVSTELDDVIEFRDHMTNWIVQGGDFGRVRKREPSIEIDKEEKEQ